MVDEIKYVNPVAGSNSNEERSSPRLVQELPGQFLDTEVHRMSLDVDSLSYDPSELIVEIERGWLNKLKGRFVDAYENKYGAPWGQGGYWKSEAGKPISQRELHAHWDAQVETWRLDPDSPFKVERLVWKTTRGAEKEVIDGECVTSADLKDVERHGKTQTCTVHVQQVLPKEQGGNSTDPSALKKCPGEESVTLLFKDLEVRCRGPIDPDVEARQVDLHVMPLKCRIPTDARLRADSNTYKLHGGVTAVRVITWDACIVWRQAEREPQNVETYAKLKDYAKRNKAEVHATGVITKAEEIIIVNLFKELLQQRTGLLPQRTSGQTITKEEPIAKLTAKDISGWVDKALMDQAMETCDSWRENPDIKPEHIAKHKLLLSQFQTAMQQMDAETGYFGSGASQVTTRHKVEVLMRSLLQQKQPALDLTADAIATILSDQRMEEIIERAQTAVEAEHTNTRTELEDGVGTKPGTLEVAHMLNLALMQFKRKKILAQLARAGLLCFTAKCRWKMEDETPRFITLVTAPIDRFEYEAEFLSWKKRLEFYPRASNTRGPLVNFRVETEEEPYPYRPYYAPPPAYGRTSTDDCVFTGEEREALIWSIIERDSDDCTDANNGKAFPSQRGAGVDLEELEGEIICDSYFPFHEPETRNFLNATWVMPNLRQLLFPGQQLSSATQIRQYFGSHCGWYFAWITYYTQSLLYPAIVGVIVEIVGFIDKDFPALAVYSVFIPVWATVYLELWARKEALIAYDWDITELEAEKASAEFIQSIRRLFSSTQTAERSVLALRKVLEQGKEGQEDIQVDVEELHKDVENFKLWFYPQSMRAWLEIQGAIVTMLCTMLATFFCSMLFSLQDRAASGNWSKSLPPPNVAKGVLTGFAIPALNFAFHRVAKIMTDREFHKTRASAHRSLARKEFSFKFVNAYASLFWIAFIRDSSHYVDEDGILTPQEMRTAALRSELIAILLAGQLVTLCSEIVLPTWKNRKGLGVAKASRTKETSVKGQYSKETEELVEEAQRQMFCDEWEGTTLEYLKMVIQFGYITMFVSAFPLAPLLGYINNAIEVRVDARKLILSRKPRGFEDTGIGVWLELMRLMAFASVAVNCGLLWFSSENGVTAVVPDFVLERIAEINCRPTPQDVGSAKTVTGGDEDPARCDYRTLYQTFIAVICLEHLIVFCKVVLRRLLGGEPNSIQDTNFKEAYWAKKLDEELEDRLQRT